MAQDRDEFDSALSALVQSALETPDAGRQQRAIARASIDLKTWDALRDQCLGSGESAAEVGEMLVSRLAA